jgi:integrase
MLNELLLASKADADMEQLIMCSYYTGMRLSEVFTVKMKTVGDIACFDVATDGGKTEAAKRLIPIHKDLHLWLEEKYDMTNPGNLSWLRTTHDAIGKKFGRLKDSVLEQVGISDPEQKKEYVHHSFRHGFVTMLVEAGFNEIEIYSR